MLIKHDIFSSAIHTIHDSFKRRLFLFWYEQPFVVVWTPFLNRACNCGDSILNIWRKFGLFVLHQHNHSQFESHVRCCPIRHLGCLVIAEIMFFYIFYNYDLKPYLWLSFVILLMRITFVLPGLLLWVETYNLGLEYFRTIPEVSELVDHDFVKEHRVVTTVVSFILLLDPQVCISLPWKAASDVTVDAFKDANDVTVESSSEKSGKETGDYFGYPSLHAMNLCLMFKLLTAIVSVMVQLVCYGSNIHLHRLKKIIILGNTTNWALGLLFGVIPLHL